MTDKRSESAETQTFTLSNRISVQMTLGPLGFTCEWIPEAPKELNEKEIKRYKKYRNEMIARLSKRIGGTVIVVDV